MTTQEGGIKLLRRYVVAYGFERSPHPALAGITPATTIARLEEKKQYEGLMRSPPARAKIVTIIYGIQQFVRSCKEYRKALAWVLATESLPNMT